MPIKSSIYFCALAASLLHAEIALAIGDTRTFSVSNLTGAQITLNFTAYSYGPRSSSIIDIHEKVVNPRKTEDVAITNINPKSDSLIISNNYSILQYFNGFPSRETHDVTVGIHGSSRTYSVPLLLRNDDKDCKLNLNNPNSHPVLYLIDFQTHSSWLLGDVLDGVIAEWKYCDS